MAVLRSMIANVVCQDFVNFKMGTHIMDNDLKQIIMCKGIFNFEIYTYGRNPL